MNDFEGRLKAAREDLKFQFFLALSFGVKYTYSDQGYTLVGYAWRGHFYVTECQKND